MEARLRVLVGKNAGQELLIPGPKFFVGRADDCQLRPRSDLISRHHCALLIEEGFLAVRDFGSKNGTLVNSERVVGERELKAGDKLTIGPLEFEVCISTPAASKKRPKVESVKEAAARTAEGSGDNLDVSQLDVSQWLTDKDEKAGSADTRVINANETSEIDVGQGEAATEDINSPSTQTTANELSETVAKKGPDKRQPGKLPPVPKKQGAADSRSAAADVLSKFFKRR
ncbi:MAG: FHA domain-containing protein [Pirellulales bacterium]